MSKGMYFTAAELGILVDLVTREVAHQEAKSLRQPRPEWPGRIARNKIILHKLQEVKADADDWEERRAGAAEAR